MFCRGSPPNRSAQSGFRQVISLVVFDCFCKASVTVLQNQKTWCWHIRKEGQIREFFREWILIVTPVFKTIDVTSTRFHKILQDFTLSDITSSSGFFPGKARRTLTRAPESSLLDSAGWIHTSRSLKVQSCYIWRQEWFWWLLCLELKGQSKSVAWLNLLAPV